MAEWEHDEGAGGELRRARCSKLTAHPRFAVFNPAWLSWSLIRQRLDNIGVESATSGLSGRMRGVLNKLVWVLDDGEKMTYLKSECFYEHDTCDRGEGPFFSDP